MTTTPTKNESLPELRNLPEYWRQQMREAGMYPQLPCTFADELEAALTREAPTEGVPAGDQQTVDAIVDRIDWWADKYEAEGGHGVIVQLLRQYAGMVSKLTATPPAPQRLAQGEDSNDQGVAQPDGSGFRHGTNDVGASPEASPLPQVANPADTTQPPHHDRGEVIGWIDKDGNYLPDAKRVRMIEAGQREGASVGEVTFGKIAQAHDEPLFKGVRHD